MATDETYQVLVTRTEQEARAVPAAQDAAAVATKAVDTEIYKLYVGTVENSIERRQRTNQYYLNVVAAIFIAWGFLLKDGLTSLQQGGASKLPVSSGFLAQLLNVVWVLPAFLLIISMAWIIQLLSLQAVSKAKFRVIEDLEKAMSQKPFDLEWKKLTTDENGAEKFYISSTRIELCVPVLLCGISIVVLTMFAISK